MSSRKSSIAKKAKNWSGAYGTAAEHRYRPTSSLYCLRNSLGVWSKETMTSNYLTASRARHVTFPRVFPVGGRSILSLHYILLATQIGLVNFIINKFNNSIS